ncbi:hypothetical protein GWI33_002313 [Rhynchophorus ferrugineus]|uniref:Uncharacterized protein n=1 Tax=Rhynchophorus ferrugineus TaxID=354439 RepID=A0A834IPH8_RHYFE|nr:hypothetical protein GWI33_002313 [Rhynchophorus ferrugineus]
MPPKKSNLNNARSREARRKRVERELNRQQNKSQQETQPKESGQQKGATARRRKARKRNIATAGKMPKPLNSQSQELIASLFTYFTQERDNGGPFLPLNCVRERVAAALNINVCTVTKISQKVKNNIVFDSPKRKRPHAKRVTNQDHLDIGSIRNQIYEMYESKETVNLGSILKELRNRQLFEGYETCIFQNGTLGRPWQDSAKKGVKTIKVDGKRYIILHAGNRNGFIPGAEVNYFKLLFEIGLRKDLL